MTLILSGCSTTERLVVERVEPAGAELPASARRVGLVPFAGDGGPELTERVQGALSERLEVEAVSLTGEPSAAVLAREGLDAILHGRVELFEGPGAPEVEAPARLRVRYQLVLPTGTVAAPLLALTVPPAELARSEHGWRSEALQRAADQLITSLRPRAVETTVEWEFADGWDEDAWERFAAGDHAAAEELLRAATGRAQEAGAAAEVLGALYYDLALCQELQGNWAQAERNYDEALTLNGSELHLSALRSLRGRIQREGGGR